MYCCYEDYENLWISCNGRTTHHVPTRGEVTFTYPKLSKEDFQVKLGLLNEINSRDTNYYATLENGIDEAEGDAIAAFWIESKLFLLK